MIKTEQKALTQKVNHFIKERKRHYLNCHHVLDRFNPYVRMKCEVMAISDRVAELEERAKFRGLCENQDYN